MDAEEAEKLLANSFNSVTSFIDAELPALVSLAFNFRRHVNIYAIMCIH